jgi:hypothetical protein
MENKGSLKLYTFIAWGTGDGVEPFVVVRRTLGGIRDAAEQALTPSVPSEGESSTDEWEEYEDLTAQLGPGIELVREWDGNEALTVDYFDGNMGYLTLTCTYLPEEE